MLHLTRRCIGKGKTSKDGASKCEDCCSVHDRLSGKCLSKANVISRISILPTTCRQQDHGGRVGRRSASRLRSVPRHTVRTTGKRARPHSLPVPATTDRIAMRSRATPPILSVSPPAERARSARRSNREQRRFLACGHQRVRSGQGTEGSGPPQACAAPLSLPRAPPATHERAAAVSITSFLHRRKQPGDGANRGTGAKRHARPARRICHLRYPSRRSPTTGTVLPYLDSGDGTATDHHTRHRRPEHPHHTAPAA